MREIPNGFFLGHAQCRKLASLLLGAKSRKRRRASNNKKVKLAGQCAGGTANERKTCCLPNSERGRRNNKSVEVDLGEIEEEDLWREKENTFVELLRAVILAGHRRTVFFLLWG